MSERSELALRKTRATDLAKWLQTYIMATSTAKPNPLTYFVFAPSSLGADKNPAGRDMFEKIQQAYELLLPIVEAGGVLTGSSDGADDDDDGDDDDENIEVDENGNKKSKLDDGSALGLVGGMSGLRNIGLLMKTQVILCKRHAAEIGVYKYPAYAMLMEVLKLPSGNPDAILLPKRAEFVRTAVDLVFQTCLVSPLNAEELVVEGAVTMLEQLLNFYVTTWQETINDKVSVSERSERALW